MRPPKKTSKASVVAGYTFAGDKHATPWDEPPCDWGRRGYGQLRAIAQVYRRDRFYETW